MRRSIRHLFGDQKGAVAATVALALIGLIAAGGIAFDYSRLAGLHTELQQAADQAALAAASQLDRQADAITRADKAVKAVGNTNRLTANSTYFANDGGGTTVQVTTTYCSAFDDAKADSIDPKIPGPCSETKDPLLATFVVVTTATRVANYAFTPIVAALSSGNIAGTAVAGVESSICNVAPLLVCVANRNFPTNSDVGKGLLLKTASGNTWAPGDYGLLDFGSGNPGAIAALSGNGLNGCQNETGTKTEPGNKNVTDATNTRMDVYDGTTKDPSICNPTTGSGCPAENTRKDMTLAMTYVITQSSTLPQPNPAACGTAASPATPKNPNPSVSYTTTFAANAAAKGFTRDSCHYSGNCTDGNFGDKNWDRAGFIAANHPGTTAATIASDLGGAATAATLTRFQVYTWELAHKASGAVDPQQIGATDTSASNPKNGNITYTFTKQCAFNQPKLASAPNAGLKSRRVLTILAGDCSKLNGKGTAPADFTILSAFDVFLTEPSLSRTVPGTTVDKEIYGEVMGPAKPQGSGSGFQYYARKKPYLIR